MSNKQGCLHPHTLSIQPSHTLTLLYNQTLSPGLLPWAFHVNDSYSVPAPGLTVLQVSLNDFNECVILRMNVPYLVFPCTVQ